MKCRNCGTEIVEKALICYRCGTATMEPKIAPPPVRPERGPLPVIVATLVMMAVTLLVVFQLPEGTARSAAGAACAVLTAALVWWLKPTRGRRRPW